MTHRGWLQTGLVAACTLAALLAGGQHALGADAPALAVSAAPLPLTAQPFRIGFESEGIGLTVADIDIGASNVRDYTFATAPTDWVPRGGTWVMQNRWTCSPQWSWYGGYGDSIASVWNKRVFEGDISVDMYAAFKMGLGSFSGYKNPNDMNITLCGDGENPDSGYSFILGGGLNMFTRIMKGDDVLAETREKAGLLPIFEDGAFSTTGFHRRWWMVKAERVGDVLSLYMDNQLVLQARDPAPIPAGHVGIWTHDNGIMLARVRISYERERTETKPPPMPVRLSGSDGEPARATVLITSATHPGVFADFESGLGQFEAGSGEDGAALRLVEGGADGRGHALQLVNLNAGGDFAATAVSQLLTVGPKGVKHIEFDYKASPDVRVNLFARVEGGLYEIVFTGLDEPSYMAQILGAIEGVQADNRWHHARFDLWGHLRRVFGDVDALALDDLFFANRNTKDYLSAGFGGNHAGATWLLDNVSIGTPGPEAVELTWQPPAIRTGSAAPVGYATALDSNPQTIPDATGASAENRLARGGLTPGTHYFHVRPQFADGAWGPVVHHRVVVDDKPPSVMGVSPEAGSQSDASGMGVQLADEGGVGVDPKSLVLAVDGTEHTLGAAGLRYDAVTGRLSFDPAAAGLSFADKQRIELELRAGSDYLGHALAKLPKWSFTMSYAADRTPPPAPTVSAATPYLCNDTFESDMGEWANYGSTKGAVVYRDSTTAASGKYGLKLYNRTNGGLFGAYVRKTPFDAGKYRLVSFDYRINDRIRVDFAVYVNGKWCKIVFTDNDNTFERIGEVPNVAKDDQWHHTEFDLYDMLSKSDPSASSFVVRHLIVADWGTMANTQHATYWIDNFRIAPVAAIVPKAAFKWASADPSGILGGSWLVDGQPNTVPPERLSGTDTEPGFADLPASLKAGPGQGRAYVHVRAADRAGNWSETTHLPVLVDSAAPSVGLHQPAAGAREARSRIEIPLSDTGCAGIDPSSIVLTVGSTKYGVTNPGLAYDVARKVLWWDGQQVAPKPVMFANGQEVPVALESAADYAGNVPAKLPRWSWTMDYSRDTEPPVVESVTSTTHPTAITDTFEEGLGEWRVAPQAAKTTKVERDPTAPASGRFSAKVIGTGGPLSVVAHSTAFAVLKYPILSFDYRVPPGVKVDLNLRMGGTWYTLVFTGDAARGALQVPNVQTDGEWHRASINLTTYLRSQVRSRSGLDVEEIVFTDQGRYKNAPGASFSIDNFIAGAPGRAAPTVTWKATDPTGIADYSYVLDLEPGTVPDEVGEGLAGTQRFGSLEQGLYFFHLRAKDGAGHWGPASHYAMMHLEAPAAQ